MSGDRGAEIVVRAAAACLQKYNAIELILVGDQPELSDLVMRIIGDDSRVRIVHASEVVTMDDAPADAIRKKKDSSMRVAIDLVKSDDAQAAVSAGNTGALMATSKFVLKTLPGIDRPAIELPSFDGSLHMLDLGANTVCSPDQLFQFAVMGSIVARDVLDIESPRVALLNIGAEEAKGHDTIKDAAALISNSSLNYVGFIEGTDIFLQAVRPGQQEPSSVSELGISECEEQRHQVERNVVDANVTHVFEAAAEHGLAGAGEPGDHERSAEGGFSLRHHSLPLR